MCVNIDYVNYLACMIFFFVLLLSNVFFRVLFGLLFVFFFLLAEFLIYFSFFIWFIPSFDFLSLILISLLS